MKRRWRKLSGEDSRGENDKADTDASDRARKEGMTEETQKKTNEDNVKKEDGGRR